MLEELIDKTLSGDEIAFAKLIQLVKPSLINTAHAKLTNKEDIEDAIQETIIKTYRNLDKLENKAYFKTWITRILVNECNNINSNYNKRLNLFNKVANKSNVSQYANNIDDKIFMDELLDKLDDDEKEIANLYFKDNLTTEKIAELLHANKNTVKSKLYRIQLKLKKLILLILILCVITTTVVFADDIIKFIISLFTTSRPAIDVAVENDYVQNVEMDFVYDNDIGIKVDYILIDNKTLNVSYMFDCKADTNISFIELVDYTITDENNNTLYSKDLSEFSDDMNRYGKQLEIENNIFRDSYLYTTNNIFPISNKLIFTINSVSVNNNNNNFETISGNWIFEIDLEDKFLNRNTENYIASHSEYINDISVTIDETNLIISMQLTKPVNAALITQNVLSENNILLENTLHEKYKLHSSNYYNMEINLGYIELKYDISKYYENIDNLHLYLEFDTNKFIDIKLTK